MHDVMTQKEQAIRGGQEFSGNDSVLTNPNHHFKIILCKYICTGVQVRVNSVVIARPRKLSPVFLVRMSTCTLLLHWLDALVDREDTRAISGIVAQTRRN